MNKKEEESLEKVTDLVRARVRAYLLSQREAIDEGAILCFGKYFLGEIEKAVFKEVLEFSAGNKIKAGRILGLHRNTVLRKIKDQKKIG